MSQTPDSSRRPFAVGDRVMIVGPHLWCGHTGTISGPFRADGAPDLVWAVNLETSWGDAAVSERDIRHVD